jgi:polyhydroxyalkanoate synthesis regulator protein
VHCCFQAWSSCGEHSFPPFGVSQSKLQQQLHNSKSNEQLLQGELESCKQLLAQTQQQQQELQEQLQQLQHQADADAKEAKAAAERTVQQLQQQLSSDASLQVSCNDLWGTAWVASNYSIGPHNCMHSASC